MERWLKVVNDNKSYLRVALVWMELRELNAEGWHFPHTECPYVTLGIIVLKYISSRDFLRRTLILFNAPTFWVKCFLTELIYTNHESVVFILTPRQVLDSTTEINKVCAKVNGAARAGPTKADFLSIIFSVLIGMVYMNHTWIVSSKASQALWVQHDTCT